MPAKHLRRTIEEGTYVHIYNEGVEKRVIFDDNQDYEVFLKFLENYLTPADPESTKKVFTVRGRTFRGTPHQPKNYFDKVELIAYRLRPNHFHLLLHQKFQGSLANFIRSLSTRYSIYFNKKYQRSGTLFQGPYKSLQIKNISQLLPLTCYLHRHPKKSEGPLIVYSSYPEYLGKRETSWVNTKIVLSSGEEGNYENLVEGYEPGKKDEELLEGAIFEISRKEDSQKENIPETPSLANPAPSFSRRTPGFLVLTGIFFLLVGIAIRNIRAYEARVLGSSTLVTVSPSPSPSAVSQEENYKMMVTVKIPDGLGKVNIREGPAATSEKIGEAYEGDTFEFVSFDSGWYEVKLGSGGTGYISGIYITR